MSHQDADARAPQTDLPDISRGRFLTRSMREARDAAEHRRLEALWERAARGDLLLTDLPAADREAVRRFRAVGWSWEWSGSGATRLSIVWPAGHVDPFAGRADDPFADADTLVRFADEAPDFDEDPDGYMAFWYGEPEPPFDVSSVVDGDGHGEQPEGGEASGEADDEDRAGSTAPTADAAGPAMPDSGSLPVGAFPVTFEAPFALPRAAAGPPSVVAQLPVSATHRWVGRWLGAPATRNGRTKVAAGPDGAVWQSLSALDEVRRYDPSGALVARVGRPGDGAAQFRHPIGLAAHPDGSAYVADRDNERVVRIAPDGATQPTWFAVQGRPFEAMGMTLVMDGIDPIDVAVTPDGREILVLDHGWRMLFRLDPSGAEIDPRAAREHTAKAIALSVAADGKRTFFLRQNGAEVDWASADDHAWWCPPAHLEHASFEDVEAAPDGTLYLVDEWRSRLFWLDPDGVVLDEIPVGERTDEAPDRIGPFLFPRPFALAAPSGVAAARHGDGVRVYVSLHDGSILVFERDPWTPEFRAAAATTRP